MFREITKRTSLLTLGGGFRLTTAASENWPLEDVEHERGEATSASNSQLRVDVVLPIERTYPGSRGELPETFPKLLLLISHLVAPTMSG
jgi:hypothetical protein